MKFICNECESRTEVMSIRVEREYCGSCDEYTQGYTVPECPMCGYERDMVKIEDGWYACPKHWVYRTTEEITDNGNPATVCPICVTPNRPSNLERSHWHYENDAHKDVLIRICGGCHKQIHEHGTLTEQENSMDGTVYANGKEKMLSRLCSLDMKRIDFDHDYHPYSVGTTHVQYVMTRYNFPDYLKTRKIADAMNIVYNGILPKELNDRKERIEEAKSDIN